MADVLEVVDTSLLLASLRHAGVVVVVGALVGFVLFVLVVVSEVLEIVVLVKARPVVVVAAVLRMDKPKQDGLLLLLKKKHITIKELP